MAVDARVRVWPDFQTAQFFLVVIVLRQGLDPRVACISTFNNPEINMTTCTLSQSDCYIQTLSVLPIEALPGSFELLIRSQLLGAKDPSALHVLHRVVITAEAFAEMRDALAKC